MSSDSAAEYHRSLRLKGFDYSQTGAYFVTLVTQERICLWGEINENGLHLNLPGKMIAHWWLELSHKFPEIQLDKYVVMPNHLHGIIWLTGQSDSTVNLSEIIQWFKTMTTNEYIRGVKQFSWPTFPKRVWQRDYYDHIIRNDFDLDNIRLYIQDNPRRWAEDTENPLFSAR